MAVGLQQYRAKLCIGVIFSKSQGILQNTELLSDTTQGFLKK